MRSSAVIMIFGSSKSKIELLELQVNVAQEAYRQAEVNYRTGAITNLELLIQFDKRHECQTATGTGEDQLHDHLLPVDGGCGEEAMLLVKY